MPGFLFLLEQVRKMKKIFISIAVAIIFTRGAGVSAEGTREIRAISLSPAVTEILFALGCKEEIVAVSSFCDYPAEAAKIEKAGSFSSPDFEKILFLKPDIVFCTGLEQAQTANKLRQLGLKVIVSDPKNFEELFDSISEIGSAVRRETEATSLVADMRRRLDILRKKTGAIPFQKRKKVFLEIWHDPLLTAGSGSFLNDVIANAGGINICARVNRTYFAVDPEMVIAENPDYIILAYMQKSVDTREIIAKRFGWKNISAVRNNMICDDFEPDLFLRSGPRSIIFMERIYQKLYCNGTSS